MFLAFFDVSTSTMFIGAQPFPLGEEETAFLDELAVNDINHPVLADFSPGQIITLRESESGTPALLWPEDMDEEEDANILFIRGPNDEYSGRAIIVATEDFSGSRGIIATLAFYRLPEDIQRTFALNAVAWMLGE